MNKNAVIGFALIVAAGALALAVAASSSTIVEEMVGKAAWYLPYAALLAGVRKLVRVR